MDKLKIFLQNGELGGTDNQNSTGYAAAFVSQIVKLNEPLFISPEVGLVMIGGGGLVVPQWKVVWA